MADQQNRTQVPVVDEGLDHPKIFIPGKGWFEGDGSLFGYCDCGDDTVATPTTQPYCSKCGGRRPPWVPDV